MRAAVTGHAVYARPGNYFSLVDFFPVFSWHATAIDPYNMSLIFDLEAVPLPGLRVAAQFGFDDINTNAVGVGDEGIPTIPAAIVGAEYARPVESVDLALYAEAGWTHYLWGGFNDEYAPARAVYRLKRDGENLLLPLTSPYGPGNAWVFTEATVRWPRGGSLRVFAELVFHRQGADFLVPFHADSDLADNPMEGTLALGGEVRGRPWRWLEAWVRPTWFYGSRGGLGRAGARVGRRPGLAADRSAAAPDRAPGRGRRGRSGASGRAGAGAGAACPPGPRRGRCR